MTRLECDVIRAELDEQQIDLLAVDIGEETYAYNANEVMVLVEKLWKMTMRCQFDLVIQ